MSEDQEKKEYEEWKEKYGHDWKTEKEIKEQEWNDYLLNFLEGEGVNGRNYRHV